MVGNVWEMVFELTTPSDATRNRFQSLLNPPPVQGESWYQIRGESFEEPLQDAAVWDSAPIPSRWKDVNIGFRCVKTAQ
jgi:hypothetical protein